jgi:hypothetical protein
MVSLTGEEISSRIFCVSSSWVRFLRLIQIIVSAIGETGVIPLTLLATLMGVVVSWMQADQCIASGPIRTPLSRARQLKRFHDSEPVPVKGEPFSSPTICDHCPCSQINETHMA